MLQSGRRKGGAIESGDGKRKEKKKGSKEENESDKKNRNIGWKLRSKKSTSCHPNAAVAAAAAPSPAAAPAVVVASSAAGRDAARSEVTNDGRSEHQKAITTPAPAAAAAPANDSRTSADLSPASCNKHARGYRTGYHDEREEEKDEGGEDVIGVRLRKKAVASFPYVLQERHQADNPLDRSSLSESAGDVKRRREVSSMLHLLRDSSSSSADFCSTEMESNDRSSGLTLLYLTPVSESSSGGSAAAAAAAATVASSSSPTPKSGTTVNERDCLTYCYPSASSSSLSSSSSDAVIAKLKGMFLTLSHVVSGITDQKPIKSFITIKRMTAGVSDAAAAGGGSGAGGKEKGRRWSESNLSSDELSEEEERNDSRDAYNIAYVHEYNSILMIALSEYWNDHLIRASDLVSSVSRMIRFRFDSLDAAFKNPSHHACITHYLNIMMSILIHGNAVHHLSSLSLFSAQKLVMDDDELNLTISEILTEYEAKDWLARNIVVNSSSGIDSVTMFAGGSCGDFIIAGTALFQKGFLIQSHLSPSSLTDIVTYLHFRGILHLSAMASCKSVHWTEVHPNRGGRSEEGESSFTSDFPENEGSRFFLLIICVKQTLLTVLLEVPFLSIDSKVMPNETIILQSIRFIVSSLQKSGIMDQVDEHLEIQSKCHVVRMQRLNEIMSLGMGSLSSSSSAIGSMLLFQHSKGKLRNRIKSLSLRDLFHNASSSLSPSSQSQQQLGTNLLSSSPTGNQQRRSLILSLPRSADDLNSKSCSSPSLVHAPGATLTSPSKRRSSANVSSPRISHMTSNESTASSLSEAPTASLIESEILISQNTTTTTMTTTASVSDSQYSSYTPSFTSYFEEQRRRLPDNLILFIDQDSRGSVYFAPVTAVMHDSSHSDVQSSCGSSGHTLSQHLMRQQVVPEFRSCCLHLRTFIQSHYPVVREYGMHFWIQRRTVPPALTSPEAGEKKKKMKQMHHQKEERRKSSSGVTSPVTPKVKGKTHHHPEKGKGVISFWAAVRKESSHREVYACFLVSTSDKNHNNSSSSPSGNLIQLSSSSGLNVSMESLSYALSLQHREI